ncbi:hypothetical protein ACFLZH_03780 [Patescibacteria group bacterium]
MTDWYDKDHDYTGMLTEDCRPQARVQLDEEERLENHVAELEVLLAKSDSDDVEADDCTNDSGSYEPPAEAEDGDGEPAADAPEESEAPAEEGDCTDDSSGDDDETPAEELPPVPETTDDEQTEEAPPEGADDSDDPKDDPPAAEDVKPTE